MLNTLGTTHLVASASQVRHNEIHAEAMYLDSRQGQREAWRHILKPPPPHLYIAGACARFAL
jgi:hypothetical protein